MKMLAGVAAAAVFTAPGAMAQDIGWYGAVDLGYHWLEDIEVESEEFGTFEPEVEDGWAGFGRLGYQLSPNIRAEGEVGYRPSDIEGLDLDDDPISGNAELWTGMINLIFDVVPGGAINPFVGVGAGIARLDLDVIEEEAPFDF
ncbi:MAG TPA: outer membrane beta-barrel protein, partial [Caulobacteraceae bacterium]|nr:outer membrane beta-barrel protein [Caulobacteraceae bacterium]